MTHDGMGRPIMVSGAKSGETARTYVSAASYTDHGAIDILRLNGNRTREDYGYSPTRLQMTGIAVDRCTDETSGCTAPSMQWTTAYTYSTGTGTLGGPANNGNPREQEFQAPGGFTAKQVYEYDGWDRLQRFEEQVAGVNQLDETYCFDAHGNRAVLNRPGLHALVLSVADCGSVAAMFPRNRVNLATYDESGALGSDGKSHLRVDAEDRLRRSWAVGTTEPVTEYEYDGEGRRVRKVTGAQATTYVYDAMGQLAAEYGGTNDLPGVGPWYVHGDALGSTRVVTQADGTVVRRSDYWPFGMEINGLQVETTYRTAGLGYVVNSDPRVKFTSKERDAETGLDLFLARYYSGAQGRFSSADPKMIPNAFDDPQSWNKYTYTRNNPPPLCRSEW